MTSLSIPRRARPPLWRVSLLLVVLLVGCRRDRPTAWERIDLWEQEPRLAAVPDPALRQGTIERRLVPLGFHRGAYRGPAMVRAIESRPSVRLAWRLELLEGSHFSYLPLPDPVDGCTIRYRTGLETEDGRIRVLHSIDVTPILAAPARVQVDLTGEPELVGDSVELLVQADPLPDCRARHAEIVVRWASPAVYGRVPIPPRPLGGPHLVLITADTLRADALGAYGQSPSVTPALDGLAAESDLFLDAFSAFNVTNPSFVSMMTGRYGKDHRIYDLSTPLSGQATTLAELLTAAGYTSKAILSVGHLNPKHSGLGQGFSEVAEATDQQAAELSVDLAMNWLAERRDKFFLWLHLFDPHTPHTPPQPFAGEEPTPYAEPHLGAHQRLYRAEVAYLDRQVGRLLDFLRSRQLLEETIVVFVADHGENLEEHGIRYRHAGLWDTTTHVPLMIRWPGPPRDGRRIRGLVQTVDLYPTLLEALGLDATDSAGVDLRALAEGRTSPRRAVFAEHADQMGVMVRTEDYLLMRSSGSSFIDDGVYLYDLRRDPGQEENLAGQGIAAEEELRRILDHWLSERQPLAPGEQTELTDEEAERLRSLGYL